MRGEFATVLRPYYAPVLVPANGTWKESDEPWLLLPGEELHILAVEPMCTDDDESQWWLHAMHCGEVISKVVGIPSRLCKPRRHLALCR